MIASSSDLCFFTLIFFEGITQYGHKMAEALFVSQKMDPCAKMFSCSLRNSGRAQLLETSDCAASVIKSEVVQIRGGNSDDLGIIFLIFFFIKKYVVNSYLIRVVDAFVETH